MEKKQQFIPPQGRSRLKRFKCLCCLIILLFGSFTQAVCAQAARVTLHLENASLEEFIGQIKRQTNYTFFYNDKITATVEPITLNKENVPLEEVLHEVLETKGFHFSIDDRTIIIRKAAPQTKQQVIKGRVVDSKGEALPGVTVQIKGTTLGTSTDTDGNFTLTIPAQDQLQLLFSFIGMEPQEITWDGQKELRVVMQEAQAELEEVVITGMFTRKANSYTGAVTTIKGEALKTVGNGNILSSLKNIDPSFLMVENLAAGSDPNATPDFQMRGQTGFAEVASEYQENPNQPLFILNGFETTLTKILDLDMNLVESVTLLKDATAKAIYGSKAANGVVVIETRRPEKGKMKITYTGSIDIEAPDLSSYDLCNAAEKLEAERRAGFYTSSKGSVTEQLALDERYSNMARQVAAGVDTYWLKKPLRVGVGHKHSLYLEGGDDYMLYGVDLSYNNVAGVMKGSDRTTLSGGITLSYRTKKFLFRNQLTIDDNKSDDSPYGSFSLYAQANPYHAVYDEKGHLQTSMSNLITEQNYLKNGMINTRYEDTYNLITENFYAEYQVLDNLRLTARLGVSKKNSTREEYKPAEHTDFSSYTTEELLPLRGSYLSKNRKDNSLSGDLGLAWSLTRDKHVLFLNAQYTMSRQKYDYWTVQTRGIANDKMDHISMAIEYLDTKPTGAEGITRDMGFVGSLNYSYDDRYLFDANYRLTGSSDFGADKRWGHFYSVGAGWNLHQEAFLNSAEWITRIKLRASTGYTGSQGFSSYAAIPTMTYYQSGYNGQLGSYLMGLANPELAWQKKYDTNAGADLSFFNGSLNARFDWYVSTTKGTITALTTPPSTGFASYTANLGEVENKGWEVYLNYRVWNETQSRSYATLYASASANTNTLKKISNSLKAMNDNTDKEYDEKQTTAVPVRYEEGSSMSTIWVVRSLGIDPETGREVFVKKNGELTHQWSSADYIDGGDTRPKVSGNFGLNAEYHGIGLNAGFTWRVGGQLYNTTLLDKVENADVHYNIDRRVFSDRWNTPGQAARFKSIADDSKTQPTSRFVEDYNSLTFSSLSVYYDFRECGFLKRSFLSQLKATFYMNDIATISSVKTERGTAYPFARSFSFSLQATF